MKKAKSTILFAFVASLFLFSCTNSVNSNVSEPTNKSDTQSIVLNSAYELSEDDPRAYAGAGKYVTLTFNPKADSSIVKDSRTILPNDVQLYWTVTGSTAAYSDTSTGGVAGEADTTKTTAETSGAVVIEPYYPKETNKLSGITLIVKVGEEYYFSAYGTNDSPATISTSLLGADYTLDTIYTDNSSATDLFTDLATANSDLSSVTSSSSAKEVHYAIKQALTQKISSNSVAKGTSRYKIEESNGKVVVYKYDESSSAFSSTAASSIRIDATATSDGTGNVLIPINLEATTDLGKGDNYKVDKIEFRWVSSDGKSNSGSAVLTGIAGAAQDIAMKITGVPSGSYDTYLIFYAPTATSGTYEDIYTIPDSLTVWKDQTSTLLASSSTYYTSSSADDTWTSSYTFADTGSSTQASPLTVTAADSTTVTYTTKDSRKMIGYNVTANNIKNSLRNVFYVIGSGGTLKAGTTETGSIHLPFDTVSDAITAIQNNRANTYGTADTYWHIIIDGTPTAEEISYINENTTGLNLVIRPYTTTTVVLTDDVTFINNAFDSGTASTFNVWLTNVQWTPTEAKTFTVGTDVYLKACQINGATYKAEPTGDVVIYKNYTDSTYTTALNGTIYREGQDTSSVFGITVSYGTNTSGTLYNNALVNYKYIGYTSSATESSNEFITNDPKIVKDPAITETTDSDYVADETSGYYFSLDKTFVNNNEVTDDDAVKYRPVLITDTEVGSGIYGMLTLYAKIQNVAIGFVNGTLSAALSSPSTVTALTCSGVSDDETTGSWKDTDTKTITVVFTVTSTDGTNYPADKVASVFADGSLTVGVYGENGESGTGTSNALSDYTPTYPSAADSSSSTTSATYTITLTLGDLFAQSAYDHSGSVDEYQAKFKFTINNVDFENAIEFTVAYSD